MSTVRLDRLLTAMADAEVDQSALASRVGCTPGAINQIITGRTRRSRLFPDIAQALGVSLAWLRGETDDPAGSGGEILAADEAALLADFRKMTGSGRRTLLEVADALAIAALAPNRTLHERALSYRGETG